MLRRHLPDRHPRTRQARQARAGDGRELSAPVAAQALAGPLLAGLALGIAFNPLASLASAPLAAGLSGSPKAKQRRAGWALAVVALAWLLGDGFRVMGRLRDVLDGARPLASGAPAWAPYAVLAVWALGGLLLGYVLPALVGAYVGRRVVRGTGWLSAVVVAASASAALAAIAAPASAALGRLAGA